MRNAIKRPFAASGFRCRRREACGNNRAALSRRNGPGTSPGGSSVSIMRRADSCSNRAGQWRHDRPRRAAPVTAALGAERVFVQRAGSLHRISRPFPLRGRVAPCADRTGDSPSHRSPPGGALASYSVGATTSPASRTCAGKSSWLSVVERDEDAPCVIVSPARCASVIRYPSPVNAGHPMFVYRLRPTIFTCACSFRARPHRLPARLQRPAPGCPIAEHG